MRFTRKKIEEVVVGILGEEGLKIVDELSDKENVSEFDLAKKIKEDIKVVRKMLYMLYNHNLVGFTRKKDKQKGWYIYYWTLIPENIKFSYFKKRREQLAHLQQRLEEENKEIFFVCADKCVRLNFDQGMDFEFHCPECGKLISQDENKDEVEKIAAEIKKINTELKKLSEKRAVKRKVVREKKKEVKERKVKKKRISTKKPGKKAIKKKIVKKIPKKKTKAVKKPSKKVKKAVKKIVKKITKKKVSKKK